MVSETEIIVSVAIFAFCFVVSFILAIKTNYRTKVKNAYDKARDDLFKKKHIEKKSDYEKIIEQEEEDLDDYNAVGNLQKLIMGLISTVVTLGVGYSVINGLNDAMSSQVYNSTTDLATKQAMEQISNVMPVIAGIFVLIFILVMITNFKN